MKRFFTDLFRVGVLMVLVGAFLYWIDPANVAVFQSLAVGVFLVGGSHLTRRVLFHRIDLQAIALKAVEEENFPAAVVFFAICAVVVSVMFLSVRVIS